AEAMEHLKEAARLMTDQIVRQPLPAFPPGLRFKEKQQAIHLRLDLGQVHSILANLYAQQKDGFANAADEYQRALAAYEDALALNSGWVRTTNELAAAKLNYARMLAHQGAFD